MKFKRHPKSAEKLERWEFLERSYAGGSEYSEGNYLQQHERESKDSFSRRVKQAIFSNMCSPVIDLYNGYLYQPEHTRDYGNSLNGNKLFESFLKNVDFAGHSYDAFIEQLSKRASIFGFVGVIVDKPKNQGESTWQQQIDADNRGYCIYYEPEAIFDWDNEHINGRKVLTKLVLLEESSKPDVTRYKVWTRDAWAVFEQKKDEEAKPTGEDGINPLGEIPFVMFSNNSPLGESPASDIKDISDVNRGIYDIDSLAHEIMEGTAFPMLEEPFKTSPIDSDGQAVEVGVGSLVTRGMDDNVGHRWIEPPHSSLTQLLEWRREYVKQIKEMAKTDAAQSSTSQAQSGEALKMRLRSLTTVLTEKATAREQAEERILYFWARWENIAFDGAIDYSTDFDVYNLSSDIENAIQAKAAVPSPIFHNMLAMDIVSRMTKDIDPAVRKAIESELKPIDTGGL